jgi:hypothetical protein
MYRYYKSYVDDEFVVVFDNPLIGVVNDRCYKSETDAISRVNEMNNLLTHTD